MMNRIEGLKANQTIMADKVEVISKNPNLIDNKRFTAE